MSNNSLKFTVSNMNENQKITAKFSRYKTEYSSDKYIVGDDGLTHCVIMPILEEGEIPEFIEGFKYDGPSLLSSLCYLYNTIQDMEEWEQIPHIINWCKDVVHPYKFYLTNSQSYDEEHMKSARYWSAVYDFSGMAFNLDKFINDLKNLYIMNNIVDNFNALQSGKACKKWVKCDWNDELLTLEKAEPKMQLYLIGKFLDEHFPKFTFELTINSFGFMQIMPGFDSVFDVAYYALAQSVMDENDWDEYNLKYRNFGVCEACGRIYEKNGNRQKYCNNTECQNERNRRKTQRYYHKKKEKK